MIIIKVRWRVTHPLPFTRGHVIQLKVGVYGEETGIFLAIDEFLTFDSPLIMAGQAFTQSAEQKAEWHKAKVQPKMTHKG
jgi:hypothetical protein